MNLTLTNSSNVPPLFAKVENKPIRLSSFEIAPLKSILVERQLHLPDRLCQLEILWIINGKGSLFADFSTHTFNGNIVFCIAAGAMRSVISETPLEGYYLSLGSEYLSLSDSSGDFTILSSRHASKKLLILEPQENVTHEMQDVVIKMIKEYNNHEILRSEILKGLVKIFSIYLTRNIKQELPTLITGRDAEMVDRFMLLVEKHFATMKRVSEYADMLCVTPNYLNQMVKRVTGFPASYQIQQQIILAAKRHAATSRMRMKEIAESLGFSDYAHFSKFFKCYSGVSFSNFRRGLIE